MALVHEKLYESKDLCTVDLQDYLKELVQELNSSYNLNKKSIILNINIDPSSRYLNIETAVPCGLILNELLTNSYKYAFPGNKKGCIYVQMGKSGNNKNAKYILEVRDNGVGISDGIDIKSTSTFGLQLVSMLTHQLGGTITVKKREGTCFAMEFSVAQ